PERASIRSRIDSQSGGYFDRSHGIGSIPAFEHCHGAPVDHAAGADRLAAAAGGPEVGQRIRQIVEPFQRGQEIDHRSASGINAPMISWMRSDLISPIPLIVCNGSLRSWISPTVVIPASARRETSAGLSSAIVASSI